MNDPQSLRMIARGYMAPDNHGINVFAQRGVVSSTLLTEVEQEITLVESEAAREPTEVRMGELLAMHAELDYLRRHASATEHALSNQ